MTQLLTAFGYPVHLQAKLLAPFVEINNKANLFCQLIQRKFVTLDTEENMANSTAKRPDIDLTFRPKNN